MKRITDPTVQPFETEHTACVRRLAAECTLLLKSNGLLPLDAPCPVALYGSGARHTVKGGTGSGDVNVRHFTTIEEGLEKAGFTVTTKAWLDAYDAEIAHARKAFVEQVRREAKEHGVNPVLYGMGKTAPEPVYDLPLDGAGELAVYALSRNSGEGADRSAGAGDIALSETEIRDICALQKQYAKFLLVLNVGSMVDLTPVDCAQNILLLGQLGTPTGDVLADLLLGKSYPSGKLAMTWAPIAQYPSTEGFGDMDDTYYKEGIYVGYRYFDTVGIAPAYPFGYGLSYTEFAVKPAHFEADAHAIRVTAKVKNVGGNPGREVVQVYTSAPQGRLDHPRKELAAFAKTRELQPGETQDITLEFPVVAMAAYDTVAAGWLLEKGGYTVSVGNSSRHVQPCGIVALDEAVLTEKSKNICPGWNFADFSPKQETLPAADVPTVHLHAVEIPTRTISYGEEEELRQTAPCTWQEVLNGTKTIADFVSGLTKEQLAALCVGRFEEGGQKGGVIGSSAVQVSGAAGETTAKLETLGLPALVMADGPAGLRISPEYKVVDGKIKNCSNSLAGFIDFMEPEQLTAMAAMTPKPTQAELDAPLHYQYCTAIPIGTALAQSWNVDAARTCGELVGKEMELFGVHLWLAPAMNIQRSPLCGRNFEYYSEDPLLSGKMAAAVTVGVQAHKGCGVTIKHFACNNQETNRMASNSIVSERALREIYLKGFEICVKAAHPCAVMSSYNLVNGEHTCNSYDLLTAVLRDEWGYDGIVMTDWYAAGSMMAAAGGHANKHPAGNAAGCVKAGNDITMPGMAEDVQTILDAINVNQPTTALTIGDMQRCAEHILKVVFRLTAK